MKLFIRETSVFKKDSSGRVFRYEIESVSRKIGNMVGTMFKESNWGRITQHIDNGCMMISACRGERTEEENAKKTDELASDLRSMNYGFIRILGGYIENKGTEDEKEVTEESFFVPKPKNEDDQTFFDNAIKLCKKYNQDSVLISLPEFCDFGYYKKNGDFDFRRERSSLQMTKKSVSISHSLLKVLALERSLHLMISKQSGLQ